MPVTPQRDRNAERHVRDERVALGVVGALAGWILIEVALRAQSLHAEDRAQDGTRAGDAEGYISGHLAVRLRWWRRRWWRRRDLRQGRGLRRYDVLHEVDLLFQFGAGFHVQIDVLRGRNRGRRG